RRRGLPQRGETPPEARPDKGRDSRGETPAQAGPACVGDRGTAGEVNVQTAPAPDVGIEQAQAALAAGRFDEALACLTPLLPPRQADAVSACRLWLLSAEALVGLGRCPEARGHLIHAWVPPGPLLALPALRAHELQIRLQLGELPHLGDALAHCLDALGKDLPSRGLLLAELARAQDASGEREAALRCWEEALPLSGTTPAWSQERLQAHLQLGRLEHLRGNDDAALEHYAAVIDHSPGSVE